MSRTLPSVGVLPRRSERSGGAGEIRASWTHREGDHGAGAGSPVGRTGAAEGLDDGADDGAHDRVGREAARRVPAGFAIGALALALLWPAFANGGLPLVFPDSLDYLTNGRDLLLGVTRPPGYAYAILPFWRVAGGGVAGLWAIAGAQALLVAWLVWLTLDLATGRVGDRAARWTLVAVPVLAGASALPFLATWIMADALSAPTLLAASLLALSWGSLRRGERAGLAALLLVGAASHQTHAVIAVAAGGAVLLLRLLRLAPASSRGAAPWLTLVIPVAAVLAVIGLNRIVHGHADTAQASPVFLLARLVGDDLAAPHAAAICAERPAMPLCRRPGWLGPGRSVDALLWQGDSPVWTDYGGIEHVRDDASFIARRVLASEWRAVLGKGLRRAVRLLASLDFPELDLRPMAEPLMREVASQTPELAGPVAASAQMSGELARHPVARIAPLVMLGGCGLLVLLLPVLFVPTLARAGLVLAVPVIAGLLANALVVGLTAEAYDRYAARLGWLPLLVLLAAGAAWLTGRAARRGGDLRAEAAVPAGRARPVLAAPVAG